ncbi:D-alanyl-D-alanine carboxypeptidase/D-alanyl-D-alanine-endopeptidase [Desulfoluna spongiiphila]|uniref:D-alanyl-D-alanine carboxypeptidase/D-alanyl-D-alanine-endopeptidase n=1 Tax=Desulfoluna spongiiphila TaxID=419481 RepID=UPI00125ACDAA|nr:D-alanyl-D-alanine carboxypeptidase [Desulfoluna spongiiphila]VVS95482.1 peptidase s13 d-ala-d-ala carboxypeptidase c [Desulfoluna spongiiphila]
MKRPFPILMGLICLLLPGIAGGEALPSALAAALHPSDVLLVTEEPHRVVYSQHPDTLSVPASTLKIATALLAFETLGEAYRFPTDAALTEDRILYLKGYGDPLLTSEVIEKYAGMVAKELGASGIDSISGIRVDDTYFDRITIPGVISRSHQPYDAPNGALCANFNTVNYRRAKNGGLISAEPQTPLLPFVAKRIPPNAPGGRIRLSPAESRLYAGHLFGWFLQKRGIKVTGTVAPLPVPKGPFLYTRRLLSPWTLAEAVNKLMAFSNNFMANQIFLASGAHAEGTPATLEKGRSAFCHVMTRLITHCPAVVEGSGISRQNQLTARTMDALLEQFAPYAPLLHTEGGVRYKTGTLNGVSTRAGYITAPTGRAYRFVIFTHRAKGNAGQVLDALKATLSAPVTSN